MDLMRMMQISTTGLTAQRTKINAVTDNLANIETTRTVDGGPYRRKMVVFEETPEQSDFKASFTRVQQPPTGVTVSEVVRDKEEFQMVLNPGHPDADPVTGYVLMPNINTMTEIADMVVARRAYDANVTAINNTKSMILKALEIGK